MKSRTGRIRFAIVAGVALTAAIMSACGSDGGSSPTGGSSIVSGSTGGVGPSGATITITGSGISPSQVTVSVGQSVTFVNSDSRSHEIASDPHPTHGTCPGIENGLGTIAAGQTKLTQGFANAGTCSFHDHLNPTTGSLQGQIRVQ